MKKVTKKLSLGKQIVSVLSVNELNQVVGGTCPTIDCLPDEPSAACQ